ncbi:MAG TPA: hypothetical protein PL191_02080 [Candidatus Saccharimonas sp.]|jgi:hypothetical protein|nr:hypothetical protein [Candidatus Saccharibacteria bacterium]MCA9336512.1 hypothetical protein [Candidatus Saccharibacteria bacterium]HPQ82507.1 hypothetical protein [Candidatus Saccharimonas sp.]
MSEISISLGVDKIIAEAKGSYSKYKENKTYDKAAYDAVVEKNAKLIELAEMLRDEISKLQSQEITKEKVETMGAAIDLMGNLDPEKLEAIMKLGKKFGKK